MTTYTITKDFGWSKAATAIKAEITQDFLDFLAEKYGTVAQIRTASGSTETNEIAFSAALVNEDGEQYTAYVSLNPTVKPWRTRPYGKGERKAFDFEGVAKRFRDWVADTAKKKADAAVKKDKKIAADEKRRKEAAAKQENQ